MKMKKQALRTLAAALSLTLAGSALWAHPGDEKEKDKEKKVERHRVVVIDKDGKRQVFEGDGPMMRRGYLGIGLTDLTPELRSHFGVPEGAGVMVSHVDEGSPADKAGIKVGDIVTRLDGKDLESSWDVRARVRDYKDGEQVPVEVWRNGKAQTLSVTVAERERPEIDMAPFLIRPGQDGEAIRLRMPQAFEFEMPAPGRPGAGPQAGTLPPGTRMFRMRSPREAELEKKLEALEKRLAELEKQLKK
jgi:membrane-associated protease RseP (regulator of RpoE activity)